MALTKPGHPLMIAAVPLADDLRKRLGELEAEGLLRRPLVLDHVGLPEGLVDGRQVLVFCSNDYLGLASHPELRRALAGAPEVEGTGATASRLIAGTARVHREAERCLASLVGAADALLFISGYAANVGAL